MTEKYPDNLTVSEFLKRRFAAIDKTQLQISQECGFDNPKIIAMFSKGISKVPLNRIGSLAKAIDVDPAYLFRLVMREYAPDLWENIEDIMKSTVMTTSELDLLRTIRLVYEGHSSATVVFGLDMIISLRWTKTRVG
jgi:transcriptional regulator with XRE-family HTH domain